MKTEYKEWLDTLCNYRMEYQDYLIDMADIETARGIRAHIEAQEKRIEKLRAILEPFGDITNWIDYDDDLPGWAGDDSRPWTSVECALRDDLEAEQKDGWL